MGLDERRAQYSNTIRLAQRRESMMNRGIAVKIEHLSMEPASQRKGTETVSWFEYLQRWAIIMIGNMIQIIAANIDRGKGLVQKSKIARPNRARMDRIRVIRMVTIVRKQRDRASMVESRNAMPTPIKIYLIDTQQFHCGTAPEFDRRRFLALWSVGRQNDPILLMNGVLEQYPTLQALRHEGMMPSCGQEARHTL